MINKKAKIYIAGHRGMVGSAITEKFEKEGYKNLILKTRAELDLFDQSAVKKFFQKEKPEYVILSAAKVGGIKANMSLPADFLYENLQIQNNVIWTAFENNVKKLLFLGSSCIYPRECSQPMKEEYFMTGPVEPTNEGYAIAKIAGMKLCEKIYQQYQKIFISCMPTNIYGENDNFDLESAHVIPALVRRMHVAKVNKDKSMEIWGRGQARREFLYVGDLADAVFWLMENYEDNEFLNIGVGEDVSIKELAFLIKEVVGYKGKLVFDASKPEGMPRKLLDVKRLFSLGWRPKVTLKEGLLKEYRWFKEKVAI